MATRGSLDSLLIRLVEHELRGCVPNPSARDEVDGLLHAALGRTAHGRLSICRSPRQPAAVTAPSTPEGSTAP